MNWEVSSSQILLESLVHPDGLDLGPLGHGVDQSHGLAVSGELPGLHHVQSGVSRVFLNKNVRWFYKTSSWANLILDESVAIEDSCSLNISPVRSCLLKRRNDNDDLWNVLSTHREGLAQSKLERWWLECWGCVNLNLSIRGDAVGSNRVEGAGDLRD